MKQKKELVLRRPLLAFDLETTGLDVREDRIVEIACVKILPDGERVVRSRRINPERPIPAAATEVHGITDADVTDAPTFAQIARGLLDFMSGCDLTGFNLEAFDLPLLQAEFARAELQFPVPDHPVEVLDSFKIYQRREPRNLSAAYRLYCNKTLEDAHSAEADALAAAEVLLAQVGHYEDLATDVEALAAQLREPPPGWVDVDGKLRQRGDEVVIGFGKHKDTSLRDMAARQPDYLRWILNADFSPQVKEVVAAALDAA